MKVFPYPIAHAFGLLFLAVCLPAFSLRAQDTRCFPVQTRVDTGLIEGLYDVKTGLQSYLGVPYAQPPVGELRWRAPQPLKAWEGVRETKAFGPSPVQAIVFGDLRPRSKGMSEDCLYLNVWTPAKRNSSGLPVLLYFYGGGFVAGDGSERRYDGASMAAKGIVVVTINYRLGIFGNLALPELSAEASYKASGNYGLLDQNAALRWVSRNIAAFGGDPKKVTLGGESAGSISVSIQMASPLSKDLIAGAIGESGAAIHPTAAPVPLREAEALGLGFAQQAGGLSLSQLRALSTRELFELYQEAAGLRLPLVIDGYLLPKSLPEIFKAGEQAQVPLLLGWNSAEIPGQAFMQGLPYTEENYLRRVRETYPDSHDTVLALYPHATERQIEASATALASDRFISYSTWKWADLHLTGSDKPVYRYLYGKRMPPLLDNSLVPGLAGGFTQSAKPSPQAEPIGAPHACEIEYCLGNLATNTERAWTADDYAVSETMLSYFAQFIKTGNPNQPGLPEWRPAEARSASPSLLLIDTQSSCVPASDDARYRFLDQGYRN